ncbi:PQQ-dependent sugar dehydrogenase [Liquorilactobacillus satsumensis]|uniref:Glucose/Sorbosone dehydrogenase domain-containing protein n=1 Tax=Liquorilactobacillus satsumensis DSM 16230 = JCM 12392 TaxID=1423801 RepID=A0A0R1UWC3_9LACO|nr:PQQ-dependent sugar dehydrogenase [Liquorilactobacillus satsumensis]KRL96948.1 hypothetical protein FD50_GL001890 [Liquorilactobacillus satsumensis DSM 16230 = JCM 12392]MCP9312456.1 PQQ-dependent sugar dehydrogenase [Liquorilactobacillus satsumensis]MCP9329043.1 PQQ-dependent sugar dehydrogenase [Liquorilactobacillus satsumensis]MCP9359745.1 PQQ-dependent sugar dehydrogenase [Liquorilactobacillus satsumensis]
MKKAVLFSGIFLGCIVLGGFLFFLNSSQTNKEKRQTSKQTVVTGVYKKAQLVGTPITVTRNLHAPWALTYYRSSLLVSTRDRGEILEVLTNGKTRTIGRIAEVEHQSEDGLLGITTRTLNGQSYLYAYYSTTQDNRIVRYQLTGTEGSYGLKNAEIILSGIPHATNHNGGRIKFGPDGMLYATTGDAGNPENAQKLSSLAGKILRMTPTGKVPTDNPFPNSLVYSYGHRNPQGLAWTDKGILYATEFGQNEWDELNKIKAGSNYGWPQHEGKTAAKGFVSPLQQWRPADASPSGLAFYNGIFLIANLRGTVLRAVAATAPQSSLTYYSKQADRLRDVIISPDKKKLIFITNNTDGRGSPAAHDDQILSVTLKAN